MKYGPETFVIPAEIINNKKLRPTDWVIYGIINWITLKNGGCITTNSLIATLADVSNRATKSAITRLENSGYIIITRPGHNLRLIELFLTHSRNPKKGNIPKCTYCNKQEISFLVKDHIIAKAKGGKNKKENLTLACYECNIKKGTKTADEFMSSKR